MKSYDYGDGEEGADEDANESELLFVQSVAPKQQQQQQDSRLPKVEDKNVTHLFVFAGGNKAGMDNSHLDADKQMSIIFDASKDSAYMNHAENLDCKTDARVQRIVARLSSMTHAEMSNANAECSRRILEMEASRSFGRHMCVLDMDSFYASVEIRDRPELAELPVAVGIGMVCTSNYVARKFGVRSGMPGFIAQKLCPQLISLPLSFGKYTAVAEQVREIVRKVDPRFSSHSLDEVIFDVTDAAMLRLQARPAHERSMKSDAAAPHTHLPDQHHENHPAVERGGSAISGEDAAEQRHEALVRKHAEEVVRDMREEIKRVTGGLTASAGIAHNTPLAKICSNFNKPDGQYSLTPMTREHVLEFCARLSTRQVGGVGKVSQKILESIGIKTMGDALNRMPHILYVFSSATSRFLLSSCLGICEGEGYARKMENLPDSAVTRRSLGAERTLQALSGKTAICQAMFQIIEELAADMLSEGLFARTVTLKLKKTNFEVTTRSSTGNTYVQTAADIQKAALALLEPQLEVGLKVRLIGVRCSTFKNSVTRKDRAMLAGVQSMDKYLQGAPTVAAAAANSASSPLSSDVPVPVSSVSLKELAATEKVHLTVDLRELGSQESDSEGEQEEGGEADGGRAGGSGSYVHGLSMQRGMEDQITAVIPAEPAATSPARKRHKGSNESNLLALGSSDTTSSSSSAGANVKSSTSASIGTDRLTRKQTVKCPVCEAVVKGSLHQINIHVDMCISGTGKKTIGQFFGKLNG